MSEPVETPPPPTVRAASARLLPAAGGAWEVRVRWALRNPSHHRVLVMVIDPPLSIPLALPLVLDHAASAETPGVRPNQRAALRLVAVPAGSAAEEETRYPLVLPPEWETIEAVGRFGYGYAGDGIDAGERERTVVARWQRVVESEPFTVRRDGTA